MSLYRTWRPKSFADLVGQEAVVRTLRTALDQSRLAHAYLFSGPRGSGKTSAAKILARCIDCVRGPTPEPDNTCEFCREMLAGTSLDVLEIDAASNRGIDEIRALRESAKFAPSQMRSKVFIIDEAHMLTREGANAFLKTLEEPPPHVVFILATTAPEALPATILSRCQRYAFRRIPVATMIARMRTISDAEGIAIDDDALGAIAYRADGGLRDALTMLEQVAAFAGGTAASGTIGAVAVDAAFGTTGRAYARVLMRAIVGADPLAALRAVSDASDAGADMLGLIRGTIAEYRHLLVARVDANLLSSDLSPADAAGALALAGATPQPKIVRGLRLLADAFSAGRLSGNPRLELETAVLRLIATHDDPTLDALATRIAVLEGRLAVAGAGSPLPATAHAPLPFSAPPPVAPAAVAPAAPPAPRAVAPLEAAPPVPPEAAAQSATVAAPPAASPVASDEPPPPSDDDDPAAGATVAVAAPDAGPTLLQVRAKWESIRMRLFSERPALRVPLTRTSVISLDGRVLTVGVPNATMESVLRDNLTALEAAIASATGARLGVAFRIGGAASSASPPAPRAPERAVAAPPSVAASTGDGDGELGLLDYARKTIGEMEPR